MGKIALQLGRQPAGSVSAGSPLLFDAVLFSTGNIDYDDGSGAVTFLEPGRYTAYWWVATQSAAGLGVTFSLTTSAPADIPASSTLKTGEVTGFGVIDVTTAPMTLSLVNTGDSRVYLGVQPPLKASLLILQDEGGEEATSARCYATAQFAHFLAQMIVAYSTTTWTVYSKSLASYSGSPLDLYTAPGAAGPGLLRLIDSENGIEALPIEHITAIYPGAGTVYDPGFTFLPTPDPLPPTCDADLIGGIEAYLPVGTSASFILGPTVSASGTVYRNPFGLIILSDSDGNTPIPLFTPNILRIYTTEDSQAPAGRSAAGKSKATEQKPSVTLLKEEG